MPFCHLNFNIGLWLSKIINLKLWINYFLKTAFSSRFSEVMINFLRKRRQFIKRPQSKDLYDVLKGYSEYSSLPGLVFIFQSEIHWAGKMFWLVIILSLLCIGIYWSWYLYIGTKLWNKLWILIIFPFQDLYFLLELLI